MLILNLGAALGFVLLTLAAVRADGERTRSTYQMVGSRFTNGVPAELAFGMRLAGGATPWHALLGFGAAGACALNSIVFFRRRPNASLS